MIRVPTATAAGLAVLLLATTIGAAPPIVSDVAIESPQRLSEAPLRAAIGSVAGSPRWRGALRDGLERMWGLGLLDTGRIEEVDAPGAPGSVRLVYRVTRAPYVEAFEVTGRLGLDIAEVTSVAALGRGDVASPERLARLAADLQALYTREGYLGAHIDVRTVADPATNGHAVTVLVDAGDRTRIGRIEIRGGERVGEEEVRSRFALREGKPFRQTTLREATEALEKRLHKDGFLTARVTAERGAHDRALNRVDVILRVEEGPRVAVVFEGATALKDAALRERLTFPDTGVIDDVEVRASARQIEAAYHEAGHAFVEVRGALEGTSEEPVARFAITEGPRVEVASVEFTGPVPVPPDRLLDQMETQPSRLLRRGLFRQDALERDVRVLKIFLASEGYPDAATGPPVVSFDEARTKAHVVIPLLPGLRVLVGTVRVEGSRVFPAETLAAVVPLRPGMPWSQAKADEGRRLVERRYASRGFHGVDVAMESERRDAVVDVTYRVVEGIQTRIGQIRIRGLGLTRESVVRRELRLESGDPLDPAKLQEAQKRLTTLGLFERVDVDPLRPPPSPFADVIVGLRERKPWHLDFGVGYSTFEGPRGFVEVGHDNLFGTARGLSLRQRASGRGDRTELIYRTPWVLQTRWKGDATLFREHRIEIGYELERYGVALGIEREIYQDLIRGLTSAFHYEAAHVNRFDVDPTLTTEDVTPGSEVIVTFTPELRLDRRDSPLDPHRGSFHLVSVRVGGVFLGGDSDFVKSRFETSWLFNWFPPTILALSGRLGLATPLRDTPALPIEERFFAGGSTTVRGYRENRLGPLDAKGNPAGGNAQLIFNAELRFPIWRFLGGAVFYDVGGITEKIESLTIGDLKSGVGGGLRVNTPVGPLRVDVGYPLDEVPHQDQKLRVYVTVGHPF